MKISRKELLNGFIAGLTATVVLTLIMIMKKLVGIAPALDPIEMLTEMASDRLGVALGPGIGWFMHFVIGSVTWGGAMAIFSSFLPSQSQTLKGVVLAVGAWLLMMVVLMPMAGEGLFGLAIGPQAPVMTFIFHAIFGAVLGATYRLLNDEHTLFSFKQAEG